MDIDTKTLERIFGTIGAIASIIGTIAISSYFIAIIPVGIIIYLIVSKTIPIKGKVKGLKKVDSFSYNITAKPNYIFIYGSLLNPESLLRTIERKTKQIEYLPCSTRGYSLRWINVGPQINMIDNEWNSFEFNDYGALNLFYTKEIKDKVDGAIIQVTNEELKKLKDRERNYKLKNITSDIIFKKKFMGYSEIYTFISDIDNFDHFVIRNEYFESIKNTLSSLGFGNKHITPENHKIVKSYYPSIKLKEHFTGKKELKELSESLNQYLFNNNCVRYFNEDEFPIPSINLPLVLNRKIYSEIIKVSETVIGLSKKSFNLIEQDKYLKDLSGYSDTCFDLASESTLNTRKLPEVTRVDICLTKDGIKVFEVNTDSPGGMFHLDCLLKKQRDFLNKKQLSDKIDIDLKILRDQKDVCDAILDCLVESWEDFNQKKNQNEPLKVIAILEKDWKMWSTRTEFEYFKKLLISENYDAEIYEPHELDFENNSLIVKSSRKKIDLVYKRVLWNSFFESKNHSDEDIKNNPIFKAYSQNSVCMVNSMNSWLLGNKLALAVQKMDLFESDLTKIGITLTENEKKVLHENMPATYIWNEKYLDKDEVLNNLDSFILKSFTGFGSKEFVTGRNNATVRNEFLKLLNKNYIVQEKLNHGRSIIPINTTEWENWNFIIGAYVVNGKCVGLEAKFAEKPPITMNYDNHGNPVGYRTAVFPTLN
ncbi:gamma-glutamylcyclotransferase family protein [Maribacter sp. 2304DJ31-5]|uniref:gamma-glutamylcyclotransferase family protein n=1 Tax=Maribacter sp. 2304DJ31-5 TaxID=3386273 RepID=UPI0039BC681C